MTYYFLIPELELTQAIINLTVCPCLHEFRVLVKNSDDTVYKLIEVEAIHVSNTLLSQYKPHVKNMVLGLIASDYHDQVG